MSKSVHLPYFLITTFSVTTTVLFFLIQEDLDSTLTMLKVILPVFAGIAVVLFAVRRLRVTSKEAS